LDVVDSVVPGQFVLQERMPSNGDGPDGEANRGSKPPAGAARSQKVRGKGRDDRSEQK